MWLAVGRLYVPRFSAQIHEEWTRNVLNVLKDNSALSAKNLVRTCDLMNRVVPNALVTGYEHRIEALSLPDEGDRHVLAAAVESKADLIITFNLKHFPTVQLAPHGITALSPDVFALGLYKTAPDDFVRAVKVHRTSLTRPPKTTAQYLAALSHGQLPQTSAALSRHMSEI